MRNRNISSVNILLMGAIAMGLVITAKLDLGSSAQAQQPVTPDVPFNSTLQRKHMIEELKQINERLARLEAKLDRGIEVKVTEMPAVRVETDQD